MSKLSRIALFASLVAIGGGISTLFADTSSVSVTVAILECSDSLDNDSDLLTDYPLDPGCSSANDNDETDPPTPSPECSDGVDNDGDGKTDYSDDLGCDSATDNSEAGEITGGSGGGGPIFSGSVGRDAPTGTQVIFQGIAFPGATVIVLADGVIIGSARARQDGSFSVVVSEITPGVYIFSIYAIDDLGGSSRPLAYTLRVLRASITQLTGIAITASDRAVPSTSLMGDLNADRRVDLIDFSILAYWWGRPLGGTFITTEKNRLNGDGQVTLEDFSILAYYWLG
ncbi:MAG: Ig-like domain-containing protein [Patescibacteria group bacterium]